MEFIPSQKGKLLLCFEGYLYKKDRTRDEKTYWRCTDQCPGRAVTTGPVPGAEEVRVTKEHDHSPDQAQIEAKKGFGRLKEAAHGHGKTSAILNQEICQQIPASAQSALPKEASLRRRVQRERRKNFPALPTTSEDIDVSGKWSMTENGEEWLIYDGVIGGGRILIFSTSQNLQTLTIHCEYMGRILPQAYCLLPGKSTAIYETMFLAIRDNMLKNLPGFEPCVEIFRMDFETSAHLAARAVFPSASFECCFFHFTQANWRNLVNLGHRQQYIENTDFALKVRMFTALAFLPHDRIRDAFYQLKDTAPEDLTEFTAYFERTYVGYYKSTLVGTQMRFIWKEPLYPPPKWSVYQRVVNDDPRTTNFLEAWHRRFSVVVGESHPNIYKFIEILLSEQAHTEMKRTALLRGESLPMPKKKQLSRNKRIKLVVEQLEIRSLMDFLEGIAHNISY